MLLNNLQFQMSDYSRDVEIWPISQVKCIRTTEGTIEFLRVRPNGGTNVMVLDGMNLNVLRPAILHNQKWKFTCGLQDPKAGSVFVNRIYQRLGWTIPKKKMAADPNPVPLSLLEFESGFFRDIWMLDDLEAFAVDKAKAPRVLFQYPKHAYVLSFAPESFQQILEGLKSANLQPGMVNKFSAIRENLYPCNTEKYRITTLELKERDISAQSAWEILYPPERVPGATPSIPIIEL